MKDPKMIKYPCGCMYNLRPYKMNGLWKVKYGGSQFCKEHFTELMSL